MSSLGIKAAQCGLRNVSAKDLDGHQLVQHATIPLRS